MKRVISSLLVFCLAIGVIAPTYAKPSDMALLQVFDDRDCGGGGGSTSTNSTNAEGELYVIAGASAMIVLQYKNGSFQVLGKAMPANIAIAGTIMTATLTTGQTVTGKQGTSLNVQYASGGLRIVIMAIIATVMPCIGAVYTYDSSGNKVSLGGLQSILYDDAEYRVVRVISGAIFVGQKK